MLCANAIENVKDENYLLRMKTVPAISFVCSSFSAFFARFRDLGPLFSITLIESMATLPAKFSRNWRSQFPCTSGRRIADKHVGRLEQKY